MANHPERVKGYRRSATHFHTCRDRLGRDLSYITSNEVGVPPVGVHSIHDRGSNLASFRRVTAGDTDFVESDEPIPSKGLIVLGTCKHDRPRLEELAAMTDINGGAAVDAIREDLNK